MSGAGTRAPAAEARAAPLVSHVAVADAQAFARGRPGTVAFAVLTPGGRIGGLQRTRTFPSASVVKAMLLVAQLRAADDRPLTAAELALLGPMVTRSDNDAAHAVAARVGTAGLLDVARAAGMRRFAPQPRLFDAQITAADQVRLFVRIDRVVPVRHRATARALLADVVPSQRWGLPPVAAEHGLAILLKGGWRRRLTHQVALLEAADGRRVAIAVLTTGTRRRAAEATIAGIARRLLGGPATTRTRAGH